MKKDKAFYSMLAFITTCIIILSLFASGITVFAEGNISPIDKYNITEIFDNTMFSEFTNASNVFLSKNEGSYSTYNNLLSSKPTFVDNYYFSNIYASSFNYYCWTNDRLYLCDSDSFVVVANTGNSPTVMCYTHISDEIYNYMLDNNNSIFYSYINSTFTFRSLNTTISVSQLKIIDGKRYFIIGYGDQKLLNSNMPVYPVDSVYSVTSLEGLEQINPNYTGGGLTPEELALQHMNFDNAKVYFNVDKNFNGNVISCLSMDSYQFDNASDYTVNINYSCDIEYHSSDGLGYTKFDFDGSFSRSLSVFAQTGSIGFYSLPFDEFAAFAKGSYYTKVSESNNWDKIGGNVLLTQVIPDALPKDTLSTVNANIDVAPGVNISSVPIAISGGSYEYDVFNFNVTYSISKGSLECGSMRCNYDVTQGKQTSESSFRKNKEILNDVNNYNNDNNYSDGDENFLNPIDYGNKYGVGTTNNGQGVSYPVTVNGGSPSASGGIAYGSNVNNSVVVNTGQDPKEVVNYIKGELLPSGDSVGYVDKLDDAVEGNKFITLMSNTFSFVPATVWNDLAFYFEVFLGILVSFFVLRLILDLL